MSYLGRAIYAALNDDDFRNLVRGKEVRKTDRSTGRQMVITMQDIGYFVMDKILSEAIAEWSESEKHKKAVNPYRDAKK